MSARIRILGIDPGIRRTGWGVIEYHGTHLAWIAHGVIAPDPNAPLAERLAAIHTGVGAVVSGHAPDRAAIENVFAGRNLAATLILGQARGVALSALALAGLAVREYAARTVKRCVTGTGKADKAQISFMILKLLPKADTLTPDSSDALAVAVTDAHHAALPS